LPKSGVIVNSHFGQVDICPHFLPARWRDQHTNSYADAHSNDQCNCLADELGFLFAAQRVRCTTDAVRSGTIRVPDLALDVIHIVW
jgi:hypothetical protein